MTSSLDTGAIARTAANQLTRRRLRLSKGWRGIAIPGALVVSIVLISMLAPVLPLDPPNSGDLGVSLLAPGTDGHLFGTDIQGRDILSRAIHGIRLTVLISLAATALAFVVGVVLGACAGYIKAIDPFVVRIIDIFLAFPSLILAVAVVAALGGASIVNVIVVLTVTGWVGYARVVRGAVLSIKESLYMEAAQASGSRHWLILILHVLPNILPVALAMSVAQFPMFMIQAASLDYLGLGVPSSIPTLGAMVQEGQQTIFAAWWPAGIPALVMAVITLAMTVLGDRLTRKVNQ